MAWEHLRGRLDDCKWEWMQRIRDKQDYFLFESAADLVRSNGKGYSAELALAEARRGLHYNQLYCWALKWLFN